MVNLAALILVAFALTLVALALFQYYRTRQRPMLALAALGGILLLILLFAASRFALQLFGALPFALDLPQFARDDLLPLALSILAGAAAVGIVLLAQRRLVVALGVLVVGGIILFGALWWTTQLRVQAAQTTSADVTKHYGLADIQLPDGFKVQEFAKDLDDPTALAFDDAGNLYYSQLVDGNIVRLHDSNGDGVADEQKIFASGFKNPRGLTWHNGTLYVSSRGQINTLRDTNGDGIADENNVIINNLFSLDVQHSNNAVEFGPDGKLYISIGGPRVGQLELKDGAYFYQGQARDQWLFGGILVADPNGKNLKLYARGLRNPYGMAFGGDGKLFAADNGDETIPVPDGDELNFIEADADYGYPYFFGIPPPWSTTRVPLIRFEPHSAPTGVVVYDGKTFPPRYRGSVLVSLYWHGQAGAYARQVVQVAVNDKDTPPTGKMRNFIQGLDRPTALAIGRDDALYIADMRGGKADPEFPGTIYRVWYAGK